MLDSHAFVLSCFSHDFISKKAFLEIDINDIGRFDPKLRQLLEDDPTTHLPTVKFQWNAHRNVFQFEKVATELSQSIHAGEIDEQNTETIQIILKSTLDDKALGSSLRMLGVALISQQRN